MMPRKNGPEIEAIVRRIQKDVSRLHSLTLYSSLTDVENSALVTANCTLSAITKDWTSGEQFKRAWSEAAE